MQLACDIKVICSSSLESVEGIYPRDHSRCMPLVGSVGCVRYFTGNQVLGELPYKDLATDC